MVCEDQRSLPPPSNRGTWGNEIARASFQKPTDATGNPVEHDGDGEVLEFDTDTTRCPRATNSTTIPTGFLSKIHHVRFRLRPHGRPCPHSSPLPKRTRSPLFRRVNQLRLPPHSNFLISRNSSNALPWILCRGGSSELHFDFRYTPADLCTIPQDSFMHYLCGAGEGLLKGLQRIHNFIEVHSRQRSAPRQCLREASEDNRESLRVLRNGQSAFGIC